MWREREREREREEKQGRRWVRRHYTWTRDHAGYWRRGWLFCTCFSLFRLIPIRIISLSSLVGGFWCVCFVCLVKKVCGLFRFSTTPRPALVLEMEWRGTLWFRLLILGFSLLSPDMHLIFSSFFSNNHLMKFFFLSFLSSMKMGNLVWAYIKSNIFLVCAHSSMIYLTLILWQIKYVFIMDLPKCPARGAY